MWGWHSSSAPRSLIRPPARPTFDSLPADVRPESLARVAELEEHQLNKCAAFAGWAKDAAGPAPHTDQIARLVQAVSKRVDEDKKGGDDLCAALRTGRFTPHWAQVAVVMAARELGIPAFGFASASGTAIHLVGTFVDQIGWVLIDIERPQDGWFTGGPPLVTLAPLLGPFSGSSHDFWYPNAGVYARREWGGVHAISKTSWVALAPSAQSYNTTTARAMSLSELCR
jgi:hypothetical protein